MGGTVGPPAASSHKTEDCYALYFADSVYYAWFHFHLFTHAF